MTPARTPAPGRSIAPRPFPLPKAELPLPDPGCGALWLSDAVLAASSVWSAHALLALQEV